MNETKQVPSPFANRSVDKLLTTDDVAAWLGIKKCTLEKARSMRLGDFPPYIRIGRAIRYRPADVEVWLAQHAFNIDGTRPLSSAA